MKMNVIEDRYLVWWSTNESRKLEARKKTKLYHISIRHELRSLAQVSITTLITPQAIRRKKTISSFSSRDDKFT